MRRLLAHAVLVLGPDTSTVRIFATRRRIPNGGTRLLRIGLALVILLGAAQASALPFVIETSSDPADGWRAIAPVGNLEGQPLASVGLAWEAAHANGTDDDSQIYVNGTLVYATTRTASSPTSRSWT